jgi:hypothetical protein
MNVRVIPKSRLQVRVIPKSRLQVRVIPYKSPLHEYKFLKKEVRNLGSARLQVLIQVLPGYSVRSRAKSA